MKKNLSKFWNYYIFQKEGGGHTIGMPYASIFMC
jgi:hypothetical protein